MVQKEITFHLQMHPPTSTTHATVTERHSLNEHHRGLTRKIQQSTKEILHILHVFWNTFIVHCQLDKHQIRIRGNVEREAKGKVVGASG